MARKKKARAWANLKDTIPAKQEDQLSERFKKILEEKDARANKTMPELAEEWNALVAEDEAAEALQSARNIKYEALEKRILEELEKIEAASGQDMYRGQGQTFSPKFDVSPSVKDKSALMQWVHSCVACGRTEDECKCEEFINRATQLSLAKPTLKSIVSEAYDTDIAEMLSPAQRAQLKPGDPGSMMPPPGVSVYMINGVNRRSTNGSGNSRKHHEED